MSQNQPKLLAYNGKPDFNCSTLQNIDLQVKPARD